MVTAITTTDRGRALRSAREAAGITRAHLAALADCSLASLAQIEQGAVPRRSRVLARAWQALAEIDPTDATTPLATGPAHEEGARAALRTALTGTPAGTSSAPVTRGAESHMSGRCERPERNHQ